MANDDLTLKISISPTETANLAALMEKLGLDDITDLVNVSLSLLQWAVTEVSAGNAIAAVNEDRKHFTVLSMNELTKVRGVIN